MDSASACAPARVGRSCRLGAARAAPSSPPERRVVLARPNRVIVGEDFRRVVRRGRRTPTALAVYHTLEREASGPARFGIVVSRAVGSAVRRNRLRRRLRAVCRELVDEGLRGVDVVIRAQPGSAERPWAAVRRDVRGAVGRPVSV